MRNENNPVRAIAIPILNIKKEETASKAQEAECQATDAESESLIVDPVTPYVECPQDSLPPSRALKTPAADRVSPRLIPSPEGS